MMNADLGTLVTKLVRMESKQRKRIVWCGIALAIACVILWMLFLGRELQKMAEDIKTQPDSMARLYDYDLPLIFSVQNADEITLSNSGEYYLVKGTITCPECVAVDDVPGDGMHFLSGNGRGYTVLGTESSADDQRQHIVLQGDDGETYYIYGLPNFYLNTYTNVCYYFISGKGKNVDVNYSDVVIRINPDIEFVCKNEKTSTFRNALYNGYFDSFEGTPSFFIHFGKDGVLDLFAAQ